jgi:hypothetical protein
VQVAFIVLGNTDVPHELGTIVPRCVLDESVETYTVGIYEHENPLPMKPWAVQHGGTVALVERKIFPGPAERFLPLKQPFPCPQKLARTPPTNTTHVNHRYG